MADELKSSRLDGEYANGSEPYAYTKEQQETDCSGVPRHRNTILCLTIVLYTTVTNPTVEHYFDC